MKNGGGDKQKKMLGASERASEDKREEREIKRGVRQSAVCYVSLKSKITIGLALFQMWNRPNRNRNNRQRNSI